MNPDNRRTAVILDPHPLWLTALQSLLGAASIDVVGKTPSASDALALVDEKVPDLLIAELRLAGGESGAACIREALRRHPSLSAVVISAHDDPGSVEEGLSTGAAAFISKTADPEDTLAAIRQIFSHSIYLATSVPATTERSRQSARLPGLTRREAEILELVSEGYSNSQVGRMLWVTEQTIKFHLTNIYRKLGVTNRTHAANWVHKQRHWEDENRASAASA